MFLFALKSFAKKLVISLFTEKFLAYITFKLSKVFVSKTKTTTDDEILEEIQKAYQSSN